MESQLNYVYDNYNVLCTYMCNNVIIGCRQY